MRVSSVSRIDCHSVITDIGEMIWLHLVCKWAITLQIREKSQYIVFQRGQQLLWLFWICEPVLAVPALCGIPFWGDQLHLPPAADRAAEGIHSWDAPWSSARGNSTEAHVCFTGVWEEAPLVRLSSTVLCSDC